jgi:2-oxoisovalerate dehydrogenase E1 component
METTLLLRAYSLMCQAGAMAGIYEANKNICKYVHSTSRGHEAIQLATAFHLLPCDFVSPYYRDESMLLGLGFSPFELMLQLLAKRNDPFSGGREYYSHPSHKGPGKPQIIHQSSATGMQVIPATGIAQGLQYLETINSPLLVKGPAEELPVVVCSLGDASVTEGEVSEAFQFAALKKLPVIFLVQDNEWGISVKSSESRPTDVFTFSAGFEGISRVRLNGDDFENSYLTMGEVIRKVRVERGPFVVQARVPLLGHHTSGVRKEFYRSKEDLEQHAANDPTPKLRKRLLQSGVSDHDLQLLEQHAAELVRRDFAAAVSSPEPDVADVEKYVFAPTTVLEERGLREPDDAPRIPMVDAALYAIREIMEDHPEAILFGQDVGQRLGGVFREAATLANVFGTHRVFNTGIQEAYIIGSTNGLSAVGVKPIVEVQFADYLYPGFNQLVTEIAKSCYLTCGKYPVQTLIRVPTGAYGGGGPYHSASIETTLLSVKGIKVVYPSNAADMKGLMKAAFYDPNPVIMLEHKGLYWSKVQGTEAAKTREPSRDYIIPLGKARQVISASAINRKMGKSCAVITYGMGVHWMLSVSARFSEQLDLLDLRTLYPLDEEMIFETVRSCGRCLVITEEQEYNSFAEALAGRIMRNCFQWLEAPIEVIGALNVPAIPMNILLEEAVLPGPEKIASRLEKLLSA